MIEWSLESCYKTHPQGPKPYLKKSIAFFAVWAEQVKYSQIGIQENEKKKLPG